MKEKKIVKTDKVALLEQDIDLINAFAQIKSEDLAEMKALAGITEKKLVEE